MSYFGEKCKNMTKRKRLKLWKEYRTWPKWYYHVVLDSIETGQLFNDESEYVDGMNTVAIAQYIHNVSIVVFNFMINHGHFLVLATGNDIVNCMSFIFRRINTRLIANGHSPLPENYGFKLIRVKDKKQLEDTIVYIARNPLKACPNIAAPGYLWGSCNLIFSDINRLFEKVQIKDLSDKFCRNTFRTRVKLPENYYFNKTVGMILPESYVMNGKAEEVLKSSWNYSNRVVRDFDAYFNLAEGIGELVVLSDEEVNLIIQRMLRNEYKVRFLSDLSVDERCRMAIVLRKKYKLDLKRISRKLHIELNILKKLFE